MLIFKESAKNTRQTGSAQKSKWIIFIIVMDESKTTAFIVGLQYYAVEVFMSLYIFSYETVSFEKLHF